MSRAARPRVSVVVPTFQRRDAVRRLLAALAVQTIPLDDYEVLVVVDGSDDGTRELVTSLQPGYALRCVWQPNAGRAAACNAGIRLAQGELVVILDDDMEPVPGLLEAHLLAHRSDPRSCVMGSVPVDVGDADPRVAHYIAGRFGAHLQRLADPRHEFVLRDFYSGNASIRRTVLLEAGGFDDAFRVYGNEDLELAYRLVRLGVTLRFCAEAEARQHYEKDFTRLARDTVEKGQTAVLLVRKHPDARAGLRLGTYADGSRAWRLGRSLMLALTRASYRTPAAVVALTRWMERVGVRRLDLHYAFVLDYLYWVGAQSATRDGGTPS
jgi:GT2 family glycosyltransferase